MLINTKKSPKRDFFFIFLKLHFASFFCGQNTCPNEKHFMIKTQLI